MSVFTEFLKLFEYDPATDGSQTFNLKQALNDNWDKVDAFAKALNASKGAASGLATLGADGILALAQRPTVSGIMSDDRLKTLAELLSEKDPKNWGLGVAAAEWPPDNNADNISVTGWHYSMGSTTNGLTAGYLFTQVLDLNHAVQFWVALESGNTGWAMRKKVAGIWQPWEWVNPPMYLGVEYRTTERYLGKPVYTKLVDFGMFPDKTNKNVAHGCSNVQHVIGADICNSTEGTLLTDYSAISNFGVTTTIIAVGTITDMSADSAYVAMRYTKTTD